MFIDQLKEGQELQKLIEITNKGIKNLEGLKNKRKITLENLRDGQYSLTICEESDGSGISADLSRYIGNADLLDLIINKLKDQVKDFESKFFKL